MKIQNLFAKGSVGPVDTRCIKCGLDSQCLSPRMEVSGKGQKSILVIGEAPGAEEDRKATQWVGKAGQFLRTALNNCGVDLNRDCWKTNAVSCRPTNGNDNRRPTQKEIDSCRYRVLETIKKYKPKYIIPFGGVAVSSTLGHLHPKLEISKLHGYKIPVQEYKAWVLPIYHPSYVMRNERDLNLLSVFNRDVGRACLFFQKEKERPPHYDYITNLDDVHLLTKLPDVKAAFEDILGTKEVTAFDYECTGTKPFAPGHKITSMAIATELGSYAFPVDYQRHWDDEELHSIYDLIIKYLSNDEIYKIAHNARFEKMWSEELLGVRPKVDWCTMDSQHLLDHRSGVTGLKFQAFIRWGIREYDKFAKKFIKSEKGTGFNKMDEMPLGDQLLYVSLDAKLTRKLYFEQKPRFSGKFEDGRKLFRDTSDVFLDMQMNGLSVDENHYINADKDLTVKIDEITSRLAKAPEILKYKKIHGKEFKESSPKDLQELLFDQMKIVSLKKTTGGSRSVDASVLSDITHPIPKDILLKRKYLKIRDSYLAQFLRECTNGYMHPNFNLNIARSLRSSATNPSFQNIPKRDEEAKIICRKGIVPSLGCLLFEGDFGGIEVCTSAIYHKDPVFINYLVSEDADMHRDGTLQLWKIPKSQITKILRFYTKNCWTFPQFYGSYYAVCAEALWKACVEGKLELADGTPLIKHLRKVGLGTLKQFTEHCREVENWLWHKQFQIYTEWKDDINESYQKTGYVETFFGFKFTDYLDTKQATNYPIQSTATHLLFWSTIQVTKKLREQGLKSVLVGQIHDSMILDVPSKETPQVVSIIRQVCEVDLRENFKWITVPMSVDLEVSKLREEGGNLAEMEEYKD